MNKLLKWLMARIDPDHDERVRDDALAEAQKLFKEERTNACFVASEHVLMNILAKCPDNHVVVFARYTGDKIITVPFEQSAYNLLQVLQPNECLRVEPGTHRVAINPKNCDDGIPITVTKYMNAVQTSLEYDLITKWNYYPYPSWWQTEASE